LLGVLPHCFEQTISRMSRLLVIDDEVLLHKQAKQVKDLRFPNSVPTAHALGRLARPAACKNRKTLQKYLLLCGEERIAPVQCGTKGLLPWRRGPAPAFEQLESVVQLDNKFLDRHCPEKRCSHLDCERYSIQRLTDTCCGLAVRFRQFK